MGMLGLALGWEAGGPRPCLEILLEDQATATGHTASRLLVGCPPEPVSKELRGGLSGQKEGGPSPPAGVIRRSLGSRLAFLPTCDRWAAPDCAG